jgi:hypothetical protein
LHRIDLSEQWRASERASERQVGPRGGSEGKQPNASARLLLLERAQKCAGTLVNLR